ncbi:hypothetical protein AB833_20565 [Chromatiales bacterium (ex Bugula neritina AB1)]|nr:hypothetical protein AB833_20565 [Chromatiales bacterium (ex Bugula neritina AB1)]
MSLDTVVVECTDYSGMELLRHYGRVLVDSEIKPEISEALNAITYGLIQAVSEGKKCLLVLDQAHELSEDALRKLVLLANLKVDGSPLLQIFMVGQPALRQTLLQPEYEALHQRLVATCNLDRFTAEETREYIIHNLTACGWQGTPEICPNVFSIIHQTSMGMPRWINLIGSRLLLQGMINEKEKIGLPDTCEVLRELLNEDLLPETVRRANLKDAKLKVA